MKQRQRGSSGTIKLFTMSICQLLQIKYLLLTDSKFLDLTPPPKKNPNKNLLLQIITKLNNDLIQPVDGSQVSS